MRGPSLVGLGLVVLLNVANICFVVWCLKQHEAHQPRTLAESCAQQCAGRLPVLAKDSTCHCAGEP